MDFKCSVVADPSQCAKFFMKKLTRDRAVPIISARGGRDYQDEAAAIGGTERTCKA
jgi:hypothetical protein